MGDMEEIGKAPFAVLFPGQRRHSKDAPYNFRHSVDPRLGSVQRLIKAGLLTDPDELNLDDLPRPRAPRLPQFPTKRKLKDIYDDDECSKRRKPAVLTNISGNAMSKEEIQRHLAEASKRYCSKDFQVKQVLRYKQMIKDWSENEQQLYMEQDIGCAKAAMEFYNKKHGTDYEIVETLGSYFKAYLGALYHCNFRAQRKCMTNSESCASPKLFFAELFNSCTPDAVKVCVILEDPDPRHTLRLGCEICPGHLLHPSGFLICSWLKERSSSA